MENGEDFFVQYYDGSSWNNVADFVRGTNTEKDESSEVSIYSTSGEMMEHVIFTGRSGAN